MHTANNLSPFKQITMEKTVLCLRHSLIYPFNNQYNPNIVHLFIHYDNLLLTAFYSKKKLNETKKNGKYYFFITPYENEDAKNCLNTFFCLCLFFYIVFFSFWDRSRANMLLLYLCILLPHLISCFSFSYCEIIHWTGARSAAIFKSLELTWEY